MANLKFSIVIPAYNRSEIIMIALQSVKDQSFKNLECLVIDDGSQDSKDLKHNIDSLNDNRFKYIWQENGGGGSARNTGIKASNGEWIAFLDSDDSFYPCKLQRISDEISNCPEVDIWAHLATMERGNGVSIVRPRRLPTQKDSITNMMFKEREFLQTSTLVVHSDLAKRIQFDPTLRKAQDVDFMVRLERDGAKLRCLPEVLSVWFDPPSENRVGAPRKPENVRTWYSRQKHFFHWDTRYAFEATYLSYEIAKVSPVKAFFFIARAIFTRSISMKIGLLSFLRAFISPSIYRKFIDWMLPFFNKAKH